jgi:hypothetical protein
MFLFGITPTAIITILALGQESLSKVRVLWTQILNNMTVDLRTKEVRKWLTERIVYTV